MNLKRPAQILTVVFAASLFTAYVVYSHNQRSRTRTVMPSSKMRQIDGAKQQWALEQKMREQAATNTGSPPSAALPSSNGGFRQLTNGMVASSSKSIIISDTITQPPAVTDAQRRAIFMGGSKSAPAFVPSDVPAEIPPVTTNIQKEAVAWGSKSAPAFIPTDVPASNPPPATRTNSTGSNPRIP